MLFVENYLGISPHIRSHLEKFPDIHLQKITSSDEALEKIKNPVFDAVITNSENHSVAKAARSQGIPVLSVHTRAPFNLHSPTARNVVIVKDQESEVEFSFHKRRVVRHHVQEIVHYIHTLLKYSKHADSHDASASILQELIDSSDISSAIIMGSRIQWCNAPLASMLGYSVAECRDRDLSTLFSDRESYIQFSRSIQQSRGTDGWGQCETSILTRNGTQVDCKVRMKRIDPMHPMKGHLMVVENLDREKAFESQVREMAIQASLNEARFQEALNYASAIAIRTTQEGLVIFSNTFANSILGFEQGELEGKHLVGTIFPKDSRFSKEILSILNDLSSGEPAKVHAIQSFTKSGKPLWIAWNTVSLPGTGGTGEEVLFLGYDVTDSQVPGNVTIRTDPWKQGLLAGTDVEKEVFDAVFHICIELFIEGRENRHVGTSFSIGDADAVLGLSRQCGINAFEKQDAHIRCVRNVANKEAIKSLAQTDGAFVVSGNGLIMASSRQFLADTNNTELQLGFGTRHSSMAGITRMTNAIGIVVSESGGTISIFKNGVIVRRFAV